ncbi:MAG: TerC family protein [Planctomycetes bacterium]|nr:TerC family protein [Planctomycetota bacterium]
MLADAEFWSRWFGIVMVDLLLAGDNAIVIALAVRTLPPEDQLRGRVWGTVGAVGLRLLFIAIISWLLAIPLLQAIGGTLLIWVAWKLLAPPPTGEHDVVVDGNGGDAHPVRAGSHLWEAVRIIIIADVTMSLDNVLAIAGTAHGDMTLVVAGIALTIPLVVWGSKILSVLMERFRWLVWVGGGILGYVAGTLLIEDPQVCEWFGKPANAHLHPLPLALGGAFCLIGWWRARSGR